MKWFYAWFSLELPSALKIEGEMTHRPENTQHTPIARSLAHRSPSSLQDTSSMLLYVTYTERMFCRFIVWQSESLLMIGKWGGNLSKARVPEKRFLGKRVSWLVEIGVFGALTLIARLLLADHSQTWRTRPGCHRRGISTGRIALRGLCG